MGFRMNIDKKYYVFVYDHETQGPFPISTQGNSTEFYNGYYTNDEFLVVESKIFNQIKEEDTYNDLCAIYKTITVTQYDNEADAQSCIAYKENWHKIYSTTKIIDK